MRLAWFTPWPPDRSGIAGRSAELVPILAGRGFAIDVMVDESRVPARRQPDDAGQPGDVRVTSAHDFVWRDRRGQYDLAVYQVGNSRLHEFIWPYLFRWPGLTVLHDARLHHARGRALLLRKRADAYRAEFAWNHPDVAPEAAELAVAGFDGPHFYQWPMTRAVVAASRVTAAHSRAAAAALVEESPDAPVEYIALGEGRAAPWSDDERRAARARFGLPPDAVLFGLFGQQSAEKRVPQVLSALAATRGRVPRARLVLGDVADPGLDLPALIRASGLDDRVHVVTLGDDAAFDAAMGAVDVSINMRWPSALETSGPWVRALAAGRPTVVIDAPQVAGLPTLDPRTWRPHAPLRPDAGSPPIAVAIDILDEDHSLRQALVRLGEDEALRDALGLAARAHWEREHTVERMAGDYERVIRLAAGRPAPSPSLPPHLRPDPLRHARAVIGQAGESLPADLG